MPIRIIAAPNALKGSLSPFEAADAIRRGVLAAVPNTDVECLPIADGGDDTAEVLRRALGGARHEREVLDARGRPVLGHFATLDADLAVLDVASASGLTRIAEKERNPLLATSFGTGQLIASALEIGVKQIIIGVGGSATVDGGLGLLLALGVQFLDELGRPLPSGGRLAKLARIDLSHTNPRVRGTKFRVACDVENPLLGPHGAARTYAPQKGATPEMVDELEAGLVQLNELFKQHFGKDAANTARTGAAGGIAAALWAILDARLESGIDLVLDAINFEARLQGAELVISAEGSVDAQTIWNKGPYGVAKRATQRGVPTILLGGRVAQELRVEDTPFAAVFPICPEPMPEAEAMRQASTFIERAAEQVTRTYLLRRAPASATNAAG